MKLKYAAFTILLLSFFALIFFVIMLKHNSDTLIISSAINNNVSQGSSATIAIIDLKKVAMESKAGKSIENQIVVINETSKKDLLDLESKIKSMEKDKLAETDTRKIDDMQLMLYDMVNTKRNQISEAYKKAIAELEIEIGKAISYILESKSIQVVLTSEAVVSHSKVCRDITPDVIARIDKCCEKIPVLVKE